MANDQGKYRINAVAEMTGIPAATLRAWERRYGVPEPRRTDSSYRVYSDADIETIRRVRRLCDDGMAPSQAAKLVLADLEQRTTESANSDDPYKSAAAAIVRAVEAFDPPQVEGAVRHAMALGPATVVYDRALRPAMAQIGDRWHDGSFSVGQEHLATQIIEAASSAMLRLVQPADSQRRAVVACFADDTHTLPSYGIALHLAAWGYRVVRLGIRTPPHAIRQAATELQPNVIALSVTVTPPPHRARELVEAYADACGSVPWLVGGAAVDDLAPLLRGRGGIVISGYEPKQIRRTVDAAVAKSRRRKG